MKKAFTITSVCSLVQVQRKVLEEIINFRQRKEKYRIPTGGNFFSKNFENFISCTAQIVGEGRIRIHYACSSHLEMMEVPVKPSFLATCIRSHHEPYQLKLITSLS